MVLPKCSRRVLVDAFADTHVHFREGPLVGPFLEASIKGGADVALKMPNTSAGLKTAAQVIQYRDEAKLLIPSGKSMTFIPCVLINEYTTPAMIDDCVSAGVVDGKVYPYERTTKSENGVRYYERLFPIIAHCGKVGMKVHLHPEHANLLVSNRDAEYMFIPIVEMLLSSTDAVIIWEHGTDARCIPFWKQFAKDYPNRFYVTLTAHHLASNEDMAFGDVRQVCKPPIKLESDRLMLIALVMEDHRWVMAGSDTAGHPTHPIPPAVGGAKHVDQGKCACGAFTAPFAHQLYAHALGALLQTEMGVEIYVNFTSRNARHLHNLPPSSRQIILVNKPFKIPQECKIAHWIVQSFWAGQTIDWTMEE